MVLLIEAITLLDKYFLCLCFSMQRLDLSWTLRITKSLSSIAISSLATDNEGSSCSDIANEAMILEHLCYPS
jgi:hypothetical protein